MPVAIVQWLKEMGLERYAEAFSAADIGPDILGDLGEADLAALGVTLGDRKRILRALSGSMPIVTAQGDGASVVPAGDGELRQLTVVFCDLVGSTALAAQLDPEDVREVISRYHALCAEVVRVHGGEVAQYLGDGVMVEFGYPRAHEDDAERAVRCALAMIAAVSGLEVPSDVHLHTRIGVATGIEVVGDLQTASRDRASVVGTTPSLAARLQSVAQTDTVLVGAATRRLLPETFSLTALGAVELKGIAEPVEVWRVDGETRALSRFASRRRSGSAAFIARELEIGLLADRWRLAIDGEGQCVTLSADAGNGKSRIIEEFARGITADSARIQLQCSPGRAASALYPVREFVAHAAGIGVTDAPVERHAKAAVCAERAHVANAADVVALLLALPGADDSPRLSNMSAEQKKTFVTESLVAELLAIAADRPLLLTIEDVHWIDPTTLELLTQVISIVPQHRILVIATARPEFASPWNALAHVTALTLNRLGRSAVEAIISDLCSDSPLSPQLRTTIVQRADGVPLFVEELTLTLIDSTSRAAPQDRPFAVPETLRDVLTARLDSLATVRELAQVGAVIGREFSRTLLAVVSGLDEGALADALRQLVASGLVMPAPIPGGQGFSFKHALVRDAAYESLLRPRRQQLHAATARALLAHFPSTVDVEPEVVAHHFEEGGERGAAAGYWQRSAKQALSRSAYPESLLHLERALALVDALGDDRAQTELELWNAVGVASVVLEGATSSRARVAYERACAIAAGLPESADGFAALWGLCYCEQSAGELGPAREKAAELIALADRLDNPDFMLEAQHSNWAVAFGLGDNETVLNAAERGVELYDPMRHHTGTTSFGSGHDAGVCGLGHGAIAHVLAGHIATGRVWLQRTQQLIESLDHPLSRCVGLLRIGVTHDLLGDDAAALAKANECLAIATEHRFTGVIEHATMIAGAAMCRLGETQKGTGLLRGVLEAPAHALPVSWLPYYRIRLAREACLAGDTTLARAQLELSLAERAEYGGCFSAPEVDLLADEIAAAMDFQRI